MKAKMKMIEEKRNDDVEDGVSDIYLTKFGTSILRTGKIFSYTFWRTQMSHDIFWSIQGNELGVCGGAWISTEYFGAPEQGARFMQEVTLTHPVETNIQMKYSSTLEAGRNCIFISKNIVQHFKNEDNSFNFEFKIVRLRRRPFSKQNY